jgi:hypothetical protein
MLQTSAPRAKANLEYHYRAVRARLWASPAVAKPTPEKPAKAVAPVALYDHPIGPKKPPLDDVLLTARDFPKPNTATYARRVLAAVCEKHGVDPQDVLSESRARHLIAPRHEAMWRLRQETNWSLPKIGGFFRRDHTTVHAAARKHQGKIDGGEV